MAPPPPPLPPLLLTLTLILSIPINAADSQPASLCQEEVRRRPCPPFSASSPPAYPFSYSRVSGCGHPSFQVHCSSPHSLLSINNLSFSLLRFDSDSTTLLLSPNSPNRKSCPHYPSIPSRPINLSGTPFRVSDFWCSRLSLLKPCSNSSSNCSLHLCPWHCSLLNNPSLLLPDACPRHPPLPDQGCQSDLLGFLNRFFSLGIPLVWDHSLDPYFSSCTHCTSTPTHGICGFNNSSPTKPFLCHHPHLSPPPSNWMRIHPMLSFILFALLCLLLLLLFPLLHLYNNHINRRSSSHPEDPTALFLHRHRSAGLLPPVFTFDELESSTNRFDPKRKLGDGGFGSVYLGQLPDDTRFFAIKQLHHFHQRTAAASIAGRAFSTKLFCNEILIMSSIDHPNLVKLHGYCSDPRGLLLVYDYVPNGTLADHLHGPRSLYRNGALTWQARVDIALQIAMAIEYLHFSVKPPIVHRDITTSNIFVEKDLRVKLGDFGLSRLLAVPEDSSTGSVITGPQGTPGYLDPDYNRSFQLTEKSDVYSYGVVLMELVTGMKAVDRRREKREVALADMVVSRIQMGLLHQVVDPVLSAVDSGRVVKESVGAVAELAFRCVAANKDDRPHSREVMAELRRIWSHTHGMKPSNSNGVVVPES